MANTTTARSNASHPIHPIYRLIFLWLEPLFALGGTIQVLVKPLSYIAISHPLLHGYVAIVVSLERRLQGLFTVIAGGWSIIVFNDIVTLRVFDRDPKVWKFVIGAHLCSDLFYLVALAHDVGGWERAIDMRQWDGNEWLTNVLTIPFLLAKIAMLFGVGIRSEGPGGKVKRG